MKAAQLIKILSTLPEGATEVIVKGRKNPVITASVPGARPREWVLCVEPRIQRIPGTIRVRWVPPINTGQ